MIRGKDRGHIPFQRLPRVPGHLSASAHLALAPVADSSYCMHFYNSLPCSAMNSKAMVAKGLDSKQTTTKI